MMPSYPAFSSPTSPPHNRFRDHSPTKSSPLRHTLSTLSNHSDTDRSSLPSRQGTVSSNASSGYSQGSYSGYDSTSDPFVTRSSTKRERSESPVKKNTAFAKWEQREQAEQEQTTPRANRAAEKMDVSPKKVKDDDWRSGIGRNESRSALRPVEINTRNDSGFSATQRQQVENLSPSKENALYATPKTHSHDNTMSPPPRPPSHTRGHSEATILRSSPEPTSLTTSPPPQATRNSLATLSRSDSMRASTRPRGSGHVRFNSTDNAVPQLDGEDINKLQKLSLIHI